MSSIRGLSASSSAGDWRADGLLYHQLNYYYRKRFGAKTWKLSLDASCGCPNRDGTLATLGCVFCDPASFSPSRRRSLRPVAEQIASAAEVLNRRHEAERFIAYFQPGSNTYGPIDRLREAYFAAISDPRVVGLAVGTRPDCVPEPVLDLLAELARRTWVVVEYGVQTVHDRTLDRIGRHHHYDAFVDAYKRTRQRGIDIGVHVILGLPGESREDMLATARELARLDVHSIKLHNLHAVRNTVLADQVASGDVRLPELDEYVSWAVDFLELTPSPVVIDRVSGDAPREYLIGPAWCANKSAVRAAIEAEFGRRGSWQGSKAEGSISGG